VRTRLIALLLFAAASQAGAQIIPNRFPLAQPTAWVSLGAGYARGWTVRNGGQSWEIGDGPQAVASLERTITQGATIGVAATQARLPVRVTTGGVIDDEDVNVSQGFATVHIANGGQFHTALDFRAGATLYSGFLSRTSGITSAVPGQDVDFSYALGYGFGYAFSPRFTIDVVQDATTTIHQHDPADPTASSSARVGTTRLVARLGF
jgi:hypothetical protein